jgi:hypothetical protein
MLERERERRESLNVRLRVIVCLCELTKMGRNFLGKNVETEEWGVIRKETAQMTVDKTALLRYQIKHWVRVG